MGQEYAVSVTAFIEDAGQVARAAEVLARAAAGLALEGLNVTVHLHQTDPDEEDD